MLTQRSEISIIGFLKKKGLSRVWLLTWEVGDLFGLPLKKEPALQLKGNLWILVFSKELGSV